MYNNKKIINESKNKEVSKLNYNLLEILFSPIHYDISLININSRIIFDLKIIQDINLIIKTKKFTTKFKNKLSSKNYYYNIFLHYNQNVIQSEISKNFENFFKVNQNQKLEEIKEKNYHDAKFENKIEWEDESPLINIELKESDLSNLSIQFIIWSENNEKDKIKLNKICDTYLFFQNIFGHHFLNKNLFINNNFEEEFSSQLSIKGKCVGEIYGSLNVEISNFFKQTSVGVKSESGSISAHSSIFLKTKKLKSSIPTELKEIIEIKNKIKKLYEQIINNKIKIRECEIEEKIKKLNTLLKISYKNSMKSYLYNSLNGIIISQKNLIKLSKIVLDFIKFEFGNSNKKYYKILILILKRGELQLNNMSILNASVLKNNKIKNLKSYLKLLNIILIHSISILNNKGNLNHERNFIEFFLAYSYFRIPKFRQNVIDCLLSNFRKEKKKTEFIRSKKISDKINLKTSKIFIILDWENEYKSLLELDNDKEIEKLLLEIETILNNKKLKNKIKKRGIFFFLFIKEWCNYVQECLITNELPWNEIPGYRIWIANFKDELKKRSLRNYPDSLLECSKDLIKNFNLWPSFFKIIMEKTNKYDFYEVNICFDLLHSFFKIIKKNNQFIPSNFDFELLISGIFKVLNVEYSINVAKVLNFIYKNFKLFPIKIKINFIIQLIQKYFVKFFLHWNTTVREWFQHIVLYNFYIFINLFHIFENNDEIKNKIEFLQLKLKEILTNIEIILRFINKANEYYLDNKYKRITSLKFIKTLKEKRWFKNKNRTIKKIYFKDIFKTSEIFFEKDYLKTQYNIQVINHKLNLNNSRFSDMNIIIKYKDSNDDFEIEDFSNNDLFITEEQFPYYTQSSDDFERCCKNFNNWLSNWKKSNYKINNIPKIPQINICYPNDEFELDNKNDW